MYLPSVGCNFWIIITSHNQLSNEQKWCIYDHLHEIYTLSTNDKQQY